MVWLGFISQSPLFVLHFATRVSRENPIRRENDGVSGTFQEVNCNVNPIDMMTGLKIQVIGLTGDKQIYRPNVQIMSAEEGNNMAKNESTERNYDIARAERKSRLAQMKGTDGKKKKIESRSVWKKVTLSVVAVVVALVLIVWLIAGAGILTKSLTAITIAGHDLKAADLNIVLGNMTASEEYGLAFTDEFQEVLDQPSQMTADGTVRSDLINQMMPGVIFMTAALNEIEKVDYQPTEEQMAEIEKNAKALEGQLAEMAIKSGRSVGSLVKLYYGPGVSLKMVQRDLRRAMLINYYEDEIKKMADVSDEKVEAFYEENKDVIDLYSYNVYIFKLKVDKDATDDDKKKALDELKQTADKAMAELSDLSFNAAVLKYVSEEEAEAIEKNPGDLIRKKARVQELGAPVHDFLKEAGRKSGDAKVIEGKDSVTLVQFTSRQRDDFKPYSVRHILIADDPGIAEADKKADQILKKEADKVLDEFMKGDQSEESFVKLVAQYSKDPGSLSTGGLYSDVGAGMMAREFEQWCTEDGRKPGDSGIVKSTHGYHIMYFVGFKDELELPGKIKGVLEEQHLNTWIETIAKDAETTVVRHNSGMKFVGKTDFFGALFGSAPAAPVPTTIPTTIPTTAATTK